MTSNFRVIIVLLIASSSLKCVSTTELFGKNTWNEDEFEEGDELLRKVLAKRLQPPNQPSSSFQMILPGLLENLVNNSGVYNLPFPSSPRAKAYTLRKQTSTPNQPPSSFQILLPGLLENLVNNSGVYNLPFPSSPRAKAYTLRKQTSTPNQPPSSFQILLPGLLENLVNNSGVYNLPFPSSPRAKAYTLRKQTSTPNQPPSSFQILLPRLLENLVNNSGVYKLPFPSSPRAKASTLTKQTSTFRKQTSTLTPKRTTLTIKRPTITTRSVSVESTTCNLGDRVFELFNETFYGQTQDYSNWRLSHIIKTVSTTVRQMPSYRTDLKDGRRAHLWFVNMRTDTERQRCYYCGFDEGFIPRESDCFGAFDSNNASALSYAKRSRAVCNNDKTRRYDVEYWPGHVWVYSRSISNFRSQNHGSGCFKYYLDVGQIYTMRGCRLQANYKKSKRKQQQKETNTALYTWGRYRALEKMLVAYQKKHNIYNSCMVSPHASLTPFARGISLWARYYVCLCYTDYCNAATKLIDYYLTLVLLVILYFVIC